MFSLEGRLGKSKGISASGRTVQVLNQEFLKNKINSTSTSDVPVMDFLHAETDGEL